ncbi:MAG TPA: thioredoxin domain-containing protein [Chitinophagales bacterium]|nr:thioredoxin domain-containing protein [Chitinophagales bacterium]
MNQLQHETSPYLLQHKSNPVDWFPWSEVALRKAKQEHKLLIISVGYAACHWCHVMEHESFEDNEVAGIMNQHFISVKVDREERPDIDQIYMNAAMITSGHGGWPLNVIALPDGKPIFAGTYFPKQNWIKVLLYFVDLYKTETQKLVDQAERITQGLHSIENIPLFQQERFFDKKLPDIIWQNWKDKIDFEFGGRKGAPKFMMPNNYDYLLCYFYQTKNSDVAEAIKITLKKMAFGGLHDVLGGGFARYSVDAEWKVPHFEKMLYDNGQLMSIYAQAYQLTKRPMYKSVCHKMLDWLEREMTDSSSGIYSSLDADSEGVEGKFYCWEYTEIIEAVKEYKDDFFSENKLSEFITDVYNLEKNGNFEHGLNVLFRTNDHEYFIEKYNISNAVFQEKLNAIHQLLFEKRKQKVRPATDDKILTEWNAITIKGLCDAYKAFGDERYKRKATDITNFILQHCKKNDYRLDRNYKNGKSTINGFLQDYAFFIEALIALHQITFEEKYLNDAKAFTEYVLTHFYNKNNGMFYITSDLDAALITRSMDSSDNVIPSGNSTMAKNLVLLSKYFDTPEYEQMSLTMLNNVLDDVIKNPVYYSNWAIVLDMHLNLNKELVIIGEDALHKMQKINALYLPDVLITGSTKPSNLPLLKDRFIRGKTLFYVCENKNCLLPTEDENEIVNLIV